VSIIRKHALYEHTIVAYLAGIPEKVLFSRTPSFKRKISGIVGGVDAQEPRSMGPASS
jgi:hypothetical protein